MKRSLRPGAALPLALASAGVVLALVSPATAAATKTVALYDMNEAVGSTVLLDSSGNGLNGTIGSEVTLRASYGGAIGHRFNYLAPNTPPAHPGHLDVVKDNLKLDPERADYAVTVRYRTTRSFGNIIQKGQSTQVGGMWKWQQPKGIVRLACSGGPRGRRSR